MTEPNSDRQRLNRRNKKQNARFYVLLREIFMQWQTFWLQAERNGLLRNEKEKVKVGRKP